MGQINFVGIVEKQNQIVKEQAEIIDGLFSLLSQHITVEEAGNLPFAEKIREAALAADSIAGKENLV
ncbi:MAG: hypothetical protein OSJ45_14310 [Lachnospiraceae bacterium]|nr:hypothetical protein [Lachnospiraceae bacterium]